MSGRPRLGRRAALLLPLALGGCDFFDNMFAEHKDPLPGKREAIATGDRSGLVADVSSKQPVTLPPPVANAAWLQSGGNAAHLMQRPAAASELRRVWRVKIGQGGGFRRALTALPVVDAARVYAMDADGVISAFDVTTGARQWRSVTRPKKNRSSNIGGGLAVQGDRLYASTGRAELLALSAVHGDVLWRKPLGMPARSAPTLADGRIYVSTLEEKLLAFTEKDGGELWSYQAETVPTMVLGEPTPAASQGFVVAGFGSGDLVALRAETGEIVWSDSLGGSHGRGGVADIASIRGMPVIAGDRVYAAGLGGLMVALDLRSGRRLWERDVASGDTPWIAGDWLFALSVDQQLAAVANADGNVRWVVDLPRYVNPEKKRQPIFWRGPVLAGDRLLVVGTDGRLLSLDPADGRIRSGLALKAPGALAPVVAGGRVYVVDDDGMLTMFQ